MDQTVFTTTTTEGYGSRLKNAFAGVLFGLAAFLGSFVLLWWNEGNSLKNFQTIGEFEESAIQITSEKIDEANNNQPIYVTGNAVTEDEIQDSIFPVKLNAMKLERIVEMYQWIEEKHTKTVEKMGGKKETTTTYEYKQKWDSKHHDSGKFHKRQFKNPSMRYKNESFYAKNVTMGAFNLDNLVKSIHDDQPLTITEEEFNANWGKFKSKAIYNSSTIYFPYALEHPKAKKTEQADTKENKIEENTGEESSWDTPEVGDIRISFVYTEPKQDVTVIGQQSGNKIVPWMSKVKKTIHSLYIGIHSFEEVIQKQKTDAKIIMWLCRFGGFLLMYIGLMMIVSPISMLLAFLPFLKNIVEAGLGFICFALALILSLITIAIAWLAVRPLYAIGLLGGALVVIILIVVKKHTTIPKQAPKETMDI